MAEKGKPPVGAGGKGETGTAEFLSQPHFTTNGADLNTEFEDLQWLAEQGATFALPIGRTKHKFEKGWQGKPHMLEEAMAHARNGGNVGLLTGAYSGNIIAIDRDVEFWPTVKQWGELANTVRIVRENASDRGKLLFRFTGGELPGSKVWKPDPKDKHPQLELLSDGRHALTSPSIFDNGAYVLEGTHHGIRTITEAELDGLWFVVTGEFLFRDSAPPAEPQGNTAANDYLSTVRIAWTPATIFEHFSMAQNGTQKDGAELRILGNGGLMVRDDKWFCHADGVGGDVVDAWHYCESKKVHPRGREFWTVIESMGSAAGIDKPEIKAPAQVHQPVVTSSNYLLAEGTHDAGNARCVAQLYPGQFAYNDALGWMAHNGGRWVREGAELLLDKAIVNTLEKRIGAALDSGEADKHSHLIKASIPNRSRKSGAADLLKHMVHAAPAEFDAEPDKLNCKNGVVDLRTGELVAHDPSQRYTHCASVDYKPDASAQKWINWLTDAVGSADIVDWLQMAIGYSLTGHTQEEILFYLFGPPRAGKGLFTETLLALLPSPLATEVNFATFTAQRTGDSQNFDLAPLKASRLIAASESNAYERFNEGKVKALTGGNDIYCAFKHRDHFSYRPQFKIWLSSNHPVNADPDDDAVWGRLRVVEFPHSHLGKEDKTLKARMRQPGMLEGVLAWAVAGAIRWYKLGGEGLPELKSSETLKQQQRGELDNVAAWLSECATAENDAFTANAKILIDYVNWCESNGVTPKKQRALSQALKRKGFVDTKKKVSGKVIRGFTGLKVDG